MRQNGQKKCWTDAGSLPSRLSILQSLTEWNSLTASGKSEESTSDGRRFGLLLGENLAVCRFITFADVEQSLLGSFSSLDIGFVRLYRRSSIYFLILLGSQLIFLGLGLIFIGVDLAESRLERRFD